MTKEATDLTLLLGKSIDAHEVSNALALFDKTTKVIIDKPTREPRWISKTAGVVIYSDKSSRRITTVFLYSQGEEGFDQYEGHLPNGLGFAMTQAQAKACFSEPPNFSNDERDTWDTAERRLVVRYKKASVGIARVTATATI